MTARSNKLVLAGRRKVIEEAKLQTLERAAKQGWVDIAAGRYIDVADDGLEDFVLQLGQAAGATRVT